MDTRRIKKLIQLVKETGIGELEVKSGEESVRICCQAPITTPTMATTSMPFNIDADVPPSTGHYYGGRDLWISRRLGGEGLLAWRSGRH